MSFSLVNLDVALRSVAVLQLMVAALNLCLVRLMGWKDDLARLPLLPREVFHVHSWFISLTLAIFAALTWRFAGEMAGGASPIARWICGAIGIFWAIRAVFQWSYYSHEHWRGRSTPTAMHWLLFLSYGGLAAVYLRAAFQP